ncbi:hypothetical protein NN3_31860 [Nocardia neocaledoniensis NBRC 108232]|uniref:Uncharacterized protein n=1 Tax=Nocardia neocaledoniensis TaxID=236511 RepID=A0A317NZR5_9NOCA|nr:hypothetical protein [Nocardia neocaledoniensis]PWV80701.1 hypothetical protein DFR69_10137 [Nocardia neocaledoniensis]GEM32179.1 hypothetical protein NN3_31860 [Nocardia neocaledoniensis NBRC 108232]
MDMAVAAIEDSGNIVVAPGTLPDNDLPGTFFGATISPEELVAGTVDLTRKTVYLCGDVSAISARHVRTAARVFVVRELSNGPREDESWPVVDSGRVPVRVHDVGVYYRRFFDLGADHFGRIRAEHTFQSLTESTKPGTAHRRGIYLSPVTRDGDALRFRLLRCSTNLSGPTEGFRPTDTSIVDALNREADTVFRDHARLDHVLAQIYHNTPATADSKQSKAKISAHADKTKDMPANGIMAFCTFYDGLDALRPLPEDPFDYGLRRTSGLTGLRFRLKNPADERPGRPAQFRLTLYPGSVFFMPLTTNRLYTHEIQPSTLDAAVLPTRLGYVVRCSKTEAVHRNGRTFLAHDGTLVPLEPPTEAGMDELRRLYAEENRTTSVIDYGDRFRFSMNAGDYRAPRP